MRKGFTVPVLDKGFVRYIDHMGKDLDILEAARISYRAPSKGPEADKKLLNYLWKNKHTSPFEMVKVKLNIKMPIFVMRQYVRHRMQNLNEVSARYTQLPQDFYLPTEWRIQDIANKQGSVSPALIKDAAWHRRQTDRLLMVCDVAYGIYEAMLEDDVAREMARMVLPINIYTEIYACWDMKNLMHFMTLRDESHAQMEIREYSKAIKKICTKLFPLTMMAYERYKWKLVEDDSVVS